MTAYKDIKQIIHAQTNLVQFESEIGTIIDDVKTPSHLHIDTFVKGQETELQAFCTLHNFTNEYNIILTAWGGIE
jgi:hypothetical protein